MDIVNNREHFDAAIGVLCTLNAMWWGTKVDERCGAASCPLNEDKCMAGANYDEYTLEERATVAKTYEDAGLPDDYEDAIELEDMLGRAYCVLQANSNRPNTDKNAEEPAENSTESPVNNTECPEETEVIRVVRDKRYRPVLYVNGERVCYGNSFMIDGNIDGALSYDVMGVPI